ncbi:MAG: PCRF domain-containing protein [Patescibacteria group bacterium]|nr:PCRF domain-containing protein [Patescibacteria group bacterium]MBU1877088.1 PCRF domain-containing protein [Patescibacteria group bacterium]
MENTENVIIEIRAGTGGEESALFANDLFRAYSKYSIIKGWGQKILESKPTDIGGIKEVIFELSGPNAFKEMQHEGGVHRVQRIPKTEKKDRVHTSTITVAVFAKPKISEVNNIRSDELRVDFFRSSGPGGQNVNKRETAVRITHIPSGLVVASQTERDQFKNKENALIILQARLTKLKEKQSFEKLDEARRTQVKWAKRSDKIRTYNYPQNRITDHRIQKSWHNLEEIMEGNFSKITKAFENITELKD